MTLGSGSGDWGFEDWRANELVTNQCDYQPRQRQHHTKGPSELLCHFCAQTVELLIESTPVVSRARSLVAIRIPSADKATRTALMSCGAQWQMAQKYWLIPRIVAKNLRLLRFAVVT